MLTILTLTTLLAQAQEYVADAECADGCLILAESKRVRDGSGREFNVDVPRDARGGDRYDLELRRGTTNPGIDTSDTKRATVRDSYGREYETDVPRNAREGDWLLQRRR